jgi:hypothetical protein
MVLFVLLMLLLARRPPLLLVVLRSFSERRLERGEDEEDVLSGDVFE